MKHTMILVMLFAASAGLAHAEEVCTRQTVYGRVLSVEPITSVVAQPTPAVTCSSDGQCVNYIHNYTTMRYATGYTVTYRMGGKTYTTQSDEAPAGLTIELLKESCVDKPKRKAVKQ